MNVEEKIETEKVTANSQQPAVLSFLQRYHHRDQKLQVIALEAVIESKTRVLEVRAGHTASSRWM